MQVLFCCAEDDFRVRHPGVLPDREDPTPGGCVDLVVDVVDAARPRLAEVRLETAPLTTLLARRGDLDAVAAASHLGDLPLEEALARLPRLVLEALHG